jgi:hypothetical protein
MDPPTSPVVGGAVVPDCVAGKSTAKSRPHSPLVDSAVTNPLVYEAKTVFSLPCSPSNYSAETVFDLAFPMAEVVLPVPQVIAGVEVPLGAMPPVAQASTSNNPRTFGRIGKNILGLRGAMARISISQGAPSLSQRSTSFPQDVSDAVPLARLAREQAATTGAEASKEPAEGRKSKRVHKKKQPFGGDGDDHGDQAQSGTGGGGGGDGDDSSSSDVSSLSSLDSEAGLASEDSWGAMDDNWDDSEPKDSNAKVYTYRNGRYVIKTRAKKAMA